MLGLSAGCANRKAPTPPATTAPKSVEDCIRKNHRALKTINHLVNRGENLYRISKAYGVSIEEIAKTNGINDVSQVSAGRTIIILNHTASGLIWPVRGRISSRFGQRGGRLHTGIDIAAPEGTLIGAAEDGLVLLSADRIDGYSGYGKIVVVEHWGGVKTLYAHNRKNRAKAGECVKAGEVIAEVGSTGNATGNHLHFEIRENGRAVNPMIYLP